MGDDVGSMIVPMAIGIGVGFMFAPAGATALGGEAAAGGFGKVFAEKGFMAAIQTASFSNMASMVGGLGASMLMTPSQPQMPDYSQQFGQQQTLLAQEQSYGRRGGAELEQILLTGSEFEKNQAFDELRRRGEDENKLLEMSGRSTRSAEDQARLDQFVEENAPPTDTEMELMAAQIQSERQDSLDRDMEAERTRLKQISAARGTLDSNRNREMNLRLAEISAANKADLGRQSRAEAVEFQKGIQDIGTQGFNRLLQGAGYAETQNRYNIELSEAERRYQESLRGAKTEDQRSLAFQKFQADLDRQMAVYNQENETSRAKAAQMLGLAEIPLKSAFGAYKQPTYATLPIGSTGVPAEKKNSSSGLTILQSQTGAKWLP